jgi:hypothetical protein
MATLLGALALFLPSPAHARTGFSCVIDHSQTVMTCPGGSTAMGMGSFILNDDQTELSYDITVVGLASAENAAHIHEGEPGTNGEIVHFLPLGGHKQGTWKSTDMPAFTAEFAAQLLAGNLYVVIHTQYCGSGEVRGNIVSDPTPTRETTWGRLKSLYRGADRAAARFPEPVDLPDFGAQRPNCH